LIIYVGGGPERQFQGRKRTQGEKVKVSVVAFPYGGGEKSYPLPSPKRGRCQGGRGDTERRKRVVIKGTEYTLSTRGDVFVAGSGKRERMGAFSKSEGTKIKGTCGKGGS